MAANSPLANCFTRPNRSRLGLCLHLAVFAALLIPSLAFGDDTPQTAVCGYASSINNILNAVSVIVVTIAVVFSGYQIAFAHKRIADVSPVLIGGILIGAASQIATMFVGKNSSAAGGCSATTSLMTHFMDHYALVTHALSHYA